MEYRTVRDIVRDLEENPVEAGGNIYHPIPFPEFSNLRTSTNCEESHKKLRTILRALQHALGGELADKKILDIGANAGFYTFTLAQLGVSVTTFEPHPRYAKIGQFLAEHKRLNVHWHPVAFDRRVVTGQEFDATLMLSVFQWMANGGSRMEQAISELSYIAAMSKVLFFELGFNVGKSCLRTNKINHYAELLSILRHATGYKNYALLGKTKPWNDSSRFLILCGDNENIMDPVFRRMLARIQI